VSEATFHRWRNQYGGMKAEEMKHLKQLEEENRRLKKLVADLALDNQILKGWPRETSEPGAEAAGGVEGRGGVGRF
jgi:hypothetical protein